MKKVFYLAIALLIIAILISVTIYLNFFKQVQVELAAPGLESVIGNAKKTIYVSSKSFSNGSTIPAKYTCDGDNTSPQITISNVPPQAKSVVLIVYDPDAPGGIFYHWIVYNLSGLVINLGEGESQRGKLLQGLNDFGFIGYGGPCPPKGDKPHRYVFVALALDIESNWGSGLHPEDVLEKVKGHVIAYGYLVGFYRR